ncbi:suppressor of rasval19 [Collariella sp. IMI 366227]|nr:suppressor of rasval19 [Collariella sp. IMI 366227]
MATSSMHNLTTLIKRLEAATSRLEDIAQSSLDHPQVSQGFQQAVSPSQPPAPSAPRSAPTAKAASAAPAAPLPPRPRRARSLPNRHQTLRAPPPPAPAAEPVPESVEEFDTLINQSLTNWVKLSNDLGGLVAEQAAKVLEAFKEERKFLLITTKAKKPDLNGPEMSVFQDLVQPIGALMSAIGNLKDANRGKPQYDNLVTVAEGIMALAWVTIDTKPFKHVEEMFSSAQFWGNKILTANKNKEPQQVEWVKAYYQVFRDLIDYVKNYYPNGIPWNPKGPAARPSSPPPPGPPPVLKINETKPESSAPPAASLNKGEDVTKGLRKVDKSEMTHKNPSLRASSTVSEGGAAVRAKSPAPGKKPAGEHARQEAAQEGARGNKWTIENFDKPPPLTLDVSLSHSILISKCSNTTIILKGKANAITVENTNRLSLVVESLVSTVDVVKSQNFIPGKEEGEEEEGDYKEIPLPSQICSWFDEERGEVVNEIVSHAG